VYAVCGLKLPVYAALSYEYMLFTSSFTTSFTTLPGAQVSDERISIHLRHSVVGVVVDALRLARTHSLWSKRREVVANESADVSIRQHTSACVSIRQHTSAYVSICIPL
jgi:hypothetical protein